ncbi:hypothetical protein H0H92_004799 [Tricholoma furcatifolium]|nr:hypothetical protein H0H92_004799 [Tricholoma furcatifolium]
MSTSIPSSNTGSMPPRYGKKLADVMDDAFKNNGRDTEDERPKNNSSQSEPPESKADLAPDKPPTPRKIQGYAQFQIASVYPPQPCERCIRNKKTCRGIGGARCENCKLLHQKCSNSSGPPRGRHAGECSVTHVIAKQLITCRLWSMTAAHQNSNAPSVENASGPSEEPARGKRKAKAKEVPAANGSEEDTEAGSAHKKRRIDTADALKKVAELETAIKKLQASVTKDLKHLAQLATTLSSELHSVTGD